MLEVEWNPAVVVTRAIKHNNHHGHTQNMAWFANVARVEWWMPEVRGWCWRQVANAGAK